MKSLTQITQEIKELLATKSDSKDYKKAKSKVHFLNDCKLILQSITSETYLENKLSELKNKAEKIESGFFEWLKFQPDGDMAKRKTQYETQMKKHSIHSQIKIIEYILEKETVV